MLNSGFSVTCMVVNILNFFILPESLYSVRSDILNLLLQSVPRWNKEWGVLHLIPGK